MPSWAHGDYYVVTQQDASTWGMEVRLFITSTRQQLCNPWCHLLLSTRRLYLWLLLSVYTVQVWVRALVLGSGGRGQSPAVSPSMRLVIGSGYQPGLHCQQISPAEPSHGPARCSFQGEYRKAVLHICFQHRRNTGIMLQGSHSKRHCNYRENSKHSTFRKQGQSCGQPPCDYQHRQRVSAPVRTQALSSRVSKTSPSGMWPLPKARDSLFENQGPWVQTTTLKQPQSSAILPVTRVPFIYIYHFPLLH